MTAGSYFGDGEFFERYYKDVALGFERKELIKSRDIYGMEHYKPLDTQNPAHHKHYFFLRNSQGVVTDSIHCAVVSHQACYMRANIFYQLIAKSEGVC